MLFLSLLMLALQLFSPPVFASTYVFQSESGKVSFIAVGKPSFLKINGAGRGVEGQLSEIEGIISGTLEFELKTLSTSMQMRDDHMLNKYLDVNHFPKAQLRILCLKLPTTKKEAFPFEGELTIKGEAKQIQGTVQLEESSSQTALNAEFTLNIKDYPSIGVPSFGGATVADNIKVIVQATATKQD